MISAQPNIIKAHTEYNGKFTSMDSPYNLINWTSEYRLHMVAYLENGEQRSITINGCYDKLFEIMRQNWDYVVYCAIHQKRICGNLVDYCCSHMGKSKGRSAPNDFEFKVVGE